MKESGGGGGRSKREAKPRNMGGGREGENKDEELRTRTQPALSGGDRREINLPVALWLCVFLYNVGKGEQKKGKLSSDVPK